MIDLFGPHGADDGELVDDGADLGEEGTDLGAGLTERLEGVLGTEADEGAPLELGDLLSFGEGLGHGLAVHFGEAGLRVEGFQMGWTTRLIEEDDAAGALRVVQGLDDAAGAGGGIEGAEGDEPEAGGGAGKESAAGEVSCG
jgi:hypothetical protein